MSSQFLPYGRQTIDDDDIAAVVETLKSDWLTQGPKIGEFEQALATSVNAKDVVVAANGTAALHLAMLALGLGPKDRVVTATNTFLASANCARYVGADVTFCDVEAATGNMDVVALEKILARDSDRKIKAVIPVHFAGQPVDLPKIAALARAHGASIVDDACHALGASYDCNGKTHRVGDGAHSEMTVFSFHPVKHVATGEGGAVAAKSPALAERLRRFRSHGMQKDHFLNKEMAFDSSGQANPWYYEQQELGFNYRLTDLQAALGVRQLIKLDDSVKKRRTLARTYDGLIKEKLATAGISPLVNLAGRHHAYHLYVVRIPFKALGLERSKVMAALRDREIGTQVHYIPVHRQPYYLEHTAASERVCPNADAYYEQALSLPMYPALTERDCERVVAALGDVLLTKF